MDQQRQPGFSFALRALKALRRCLTPSAALRSWSVQIHPNHWHGLGRARGCSTTSVLTGGQVIRWNLEDVTSCSYGISTLIGSNNSGDRVCQLRGDWKPIPWKTKPIETSVIPDLLRKNPKQDIWLKGQSTPNSIIHYFSFGPSSWISVCLLSNKI